MEKVKKYEALFEPIKINKLEIKNRIVMAPMCTFLNTHDGYVNDATLAYFAARAKGGTGLIMTMPIGCSPFTAERTPFFNLCLWDSAHKPGIAELAETIHYFDAKVFGQLTAFGAGRQSKGGVGRMKGLEMVAPSETEPYHIADGMVPEKMKKQCEKRGWPIWPVPFENGGRPRAFTVDEIEMLEDDMARGAMLSKICGLDGVEMHFPHGYGGYSFLSPRTNFRNDLYGGSFSNRTRVLRNCLKKIRALVGPDFPVAFRISAAEHMPGGLTVEDTAEICKSAEEWGADFIHLSDGCYEAFKYFLPDTDGTILDEAKIIKGAVTIPIITPSVHDPDMAEKAIIEGKTDMVSLGRQLIADPDWANKVASGKGFVKCIRCNIGCIRRILRQLPIRCELNPAAGYERFLPEYRLSSPPDKQSWYPTIEP